MKKKKLLIILFLFVFIIPIILNNQTLLFGDVELIENGDFESYGYWRHETTAQNPDQKVSELFFEDDGSTANTAAKIVVTDTIETPVSKVSVVPLLAKELYKLTK